MNKVSIPFINIFCILVLAQQLSCIKVDDGASATEATPSPTPLVTNYTNCVVEGENTEKCKLPEGSYYYLSAYGGRSEVQNSNYNVGNGTLTVTMATAWHPGTTTATFSDTNLLASNIKAGISIFGATGSFVTTSTMDTCLLSTTTGTSVHGTAPGNCVVAQNFFAYANAFGGRNVTCGTTDGSQNSESCWLDHEQTYYLSQSSVGALPACASGSIATTCKTNPGTFYYSSAYGGRLNNCTVSPTSVTSGSCWLDIAVDGRVSISAQDTGSVDICAGDGKKPQSCVTPGVSWVYTTDYGGRSAICGDDSGGLCFLNKNLKDQLAVNLKSENIKAGVNIFGITGLFRGEGSWKSGAHRSSSAYPVALSDEVFTYGGSSAKLNLPDGYHEIPMSLSDDEGTNSIEVEGVDRYGWGSKTCGVTSGTNNVTLKQKLEDCGNKFSNSALWDGTIKGNAGQGIWKLVSRIYEGSTGYEVWLDDNTGLLWSSLVSSSLNWCKAGGSNNISANPSVEDDPSNICDSSAYQNTTGSAISACFQNQNYQQSIPDFTATDVSINDFGKAGLSYPLVAWRLPSFYDYEVADYHGLRFVLPDYGVTRASSDSLYEWTATVFSGDSSQAWQVRSRTGEQYIIDRSTNAGVRCIGRADLTK
jgi:hypothetical protein